MDKIFLRQIEQNRVNHAYIIVGSYCDKKKEAQEFINALGCKWENVLKIGLLDDERTISIKQIRELRKNFAMTGYNSGWRVILIEDADTMTTEAQNAILKNLEEPPKNLVVILLVSDEDNILRTISSRCQRVRTATSRKFLETIAGSLPEDLIHKKWTIEQKFKFAQELSMEKNILPTMDLWVIQLEELAKGDIKNTRLVKLIRCVQQAKKMLQSNTSSRLVIENLLLYFESEPV